MSRLPPALGWRELNLAFLAELSSQLTGVSDAPRLMSIAAQRITAHLHGVRCNFVTIDDAATHATIAHDHHPGGQASLLGTYRLSDFLDDESERLSLAKGTPLVVSDVRHEPRTAPAAARFEALGIRASVIVPYLRDGHRKFALAVHADAPRQWRDDEVELLQELAARLHLLLERANAEATLRESEERFRALFDAIDEGLCIVDVLFDDAQKPVGHRIVQANAAIERLTGLPPANEADGSVAVGRAFWLDACAEVARHGEPMRFEHHCQAADAWFDVRVTRLGAATAARVAVVVNDISERKRQHLALQRSEARLRRVFESNVVGMIHWNLDSSLILHANAQFLRMTGYSRDDLRHGRLNFRQLTPTEWAGRNEQGIRDIREHGHAAPYEKEYLRRDGSRLPVIIAGTRFEDAPAEGMSFVLDISEAKRAEAALRDNQARLRNAAAELALAARRKDEFLAMLAHELRNPLATLKNSVELMKRSRGNAGMMEKVSAMVERQTEQMLRLTEDLLDVSRISHDKLQLRRQPLELIALLRQAADTAAPDFERAGVQLHVALLPQPVWLDADPVRLAQVMSNLLSNACKYTARDGRVWLGVEQEGGSVAVRVKDSGAGIPADMLEQVFDLFVQVEGALEYSSGGLGIGLSLVRRLVHMHGGTVTAHSVGRGHGSEFVVQFPVFPILPALAEPPALAQPAPVPASEMKAPDGRVPTAPSGVAAGWRILVVDDNRDGAASLSAFLSLTGNDTQMAHDGEQALQLAASYRPDVILLDIGLPKLSGLEVCRAIREQPWGQTMVIVALSGWGQESDRRKTAEAGFDGHLVKPLEPDEFAALLASLQPGRRPRLHTAY